MSNSKGCEGSIGGQCASHSMDDSVDLGSFLSELEDTYGMYAGILGDTHWANVDCYETY